MSDICAEKGLESLVLDLYEINKLYCKFDAIYSMNVLLHIPPQELDAILRDISNRLNPMGLFYLGVYGGKDIEKIINDKTRMGEDRYFSFLSNESLLSYASKYFDVVDFRTIDQPDKVDEWYLYQSLTLKKK